MNNNLEQQYHTDKNSNFKHHTIENHHIENPDVIDNITLDSNTLDSNINNSHSSPPVGSATRGVPEENSMGVLKLKARYSLC